MPTKVWKTPIEVANRLDELGLTLESLIEVVEAMVRAKAECTDNDPIGSQGWAAYRMGTRRLREVTLTQEEWEKDDTDQIASTLNRKLGIRVAVSNTDDATGVDEEGREPQNRSKKGAATDRAIQSNQLSFMNVLDASLNVIPLDRLRQKPSSIVTWYVCVYSEGDEYRGELACPIGIEAGFYTGFVERIFLKGKDPGDGGAARRRSGGDGPEFDIPVTRKK
jgi:hypothetical protein